MLNQSEQINVTSSSDVTISGYPGHRVVLAVQPFQNSTMTFHQISTWTTIGNKVYLLRYEGGELMFNQHLPEVSQMLETFNIASSNNMTTLTAGENQTQKTAANQSGGDGGGPLESLTKPLQDLFGGGGE